MSGEGNRWTENMERGGGGGEGEREGGGWRGEEPADWARCSSHLLDILKNKNYDFTLTFSSGLKTVNPTQNIPLGRQFTENKGTQKQTHTTSTAM